MRARRRFDPFLTGTVVVISILVIYIVSSFMGLDRFWDNSYDKPRLASEDAIRRAAVQCYALEGSYPPDITYLEDHYGIVLNRDRYYYYYETFGSNIMPVVGVYVKNAKPGAVEGVGVP